MHDFPWTYLINYFLFVLLACASWVFGHLASIPFRSQLYCQGLFTRIFIKMLAGLCAAICLYSLLLTAGKTVHVGLLLVFLFLLYEVYRYTRRNNRPVALTASPVAGGTLRDVMRYAPQLCLISVFIFAWFARIIVNNGAPLGYNLADKDKIYYAAIADMLSLGQENRAGVYNIMDAGYHGVAPYHYFELWLTNLASRLTAQPAVVSLYLVTYPLLNFISALGILALIERFRAVTWPCILLVVLLLFTSGLYFFQRNPDAWYTMNFAESPLEFMGEKFASYYPFVLLSALFFLESNMLAGLTTLLFLPIVSISTFPAIVGAVLVFLFILFFRDKGARPDLLRLCLYVLVVAAFLYLFYANFAVKNDPYFKRETLAYTDLAGGLKVLIAELAARIWTVPFRFILLNLVALGAGVLAFRYGPAPARKLFVLSVLIYLVSLLCYGTFYKLFEGVQFYTNALALINACLIVSLVIVFAARSFPGRITLYVRSVVLAALVLKFGLALHMHGLVTGRNQVYSDAYLAAVKQMQPALEERSLIGALFASSPPDRNLRHDDKSGVHLPYLAYMPAFYQALDLSVHEISDYYPLEPIAEVQRQAADNTPFGRFIRMEKNLGAFVSYETAQVKFIRAHRIRFLVISAFAQTSQGIESIIKHQVRDEQTGERFVRLEY